MRHWGLAWLVVAGVGADAGAAPAPRAPVRAATACPVAARVEIAVPAEIDEVRAVVTDGAPGAASEVTVLDGHADRALDAFGSGTWGLRFTRPLPAGRLVVAVTPDLDAPASACVDHVELLRRGAVVARVVPR
jgi:hypothetical protein